MDVKVLLLIEKLQNLTGKKVVLTEHIVNILPTNIGDKHKYIDNVWELLQSSYKGKVLGNGTQDKDTFIKTVPFWKLVIKNGRIVAGLFYKMKDGRKLVASVTDGSREGLSSLVNLGKEELTQKRSYSEISGTPLALQVKLVPDLKKYAIPFEQVQSILKDDVITKPPADDPYLEKFPQLKDYFYQREIGGEKITKLMVGKYDGHNPLPMKQLAA